MFVTLLAFPVMFAFSLVGAKHVAFWSWGRPVLSFLVLDDGHRTAQLVTLGQTTMG